MRIYTCYYAAYPQLLGDRVPISISASAPGFFHGEKLPELFPSWKMIGDYKTDGDWEKYTQRYTEEVLDKLSASLIYEKLEEMSGGKDVVLLCWEGPDKDCHRHLVSDWLQSYGFGCRELTEENCRQ